MPEYNGVQNVSSRIEMNERKVFMGVFDNIGEKVSKTGRGAICKTRDLAVNVKLSGELHALEEKLILAYAKIGKEYTKLHENDSDVILPEVIEQINGIKQEVIELKRRIAQLKKKKICSACNSENAPSAMYCSACGKKLDS